MHSFILFADFQLQEKTLTWYSLKLHRKNSCLIKDPHKVFLDVCCSYFWKQYALEEKIYHILQIFPIKAFCNDSMVLWNDFLNCFSKQLPIFN